MVTKILNEQKEFKIAEKDGQIGYYNTLIHLYATFHNDDKIFSLMWTEYNEDFKIFYSDYIDNQQKYGSNHGILTQQGKTPPENTYTVFCIPWVNFKYFAVHTYENKPYYFPSVEAGKFYEQNRKTLMHLSLTCHHATTDGYHVNQFIEQFQHSADEFEKFI